MKIERIIVGPIMTNCYILTKNNKSLIIDPGDDANLIIDRVKGSVEGIIITHYHFDHIGALEEIKSKYQCPVYDISNLIAGINQIADFSFECIPTPGHKEDLITIYFRDDACMFVGDFVFESGLGRMDLPGGNLLEMISSVKKLLTYNENTILYPGHGNETSIKLEKNNLKEFIEYYENLM